MTSYPRPRRLVGFLVTAAILAAMLPVADNLEGAQRNAFCRPAAALAASMLGSSAVLSADGSGYTIPLAPMPILVAPECGGVRFFCIAAALLAGLCVERRRTGLACAMLPAAYALTVTANTARIVSGWQARRLAIGRLGAGDLATVHMMVGAVCFLGFLIIAYTLVERSLRHERSPVAA